MTIPYVVVSPGGNTTALVSAPLTRSQQPRIAQHLMLTDARLEQVGYVESPSLPGSSAHLQMMGGEFCGNAARALAFLLWNHAELLDRRNVTTPTITLELSGSPRPVQLTQHSQGRVNLLLTLLPTDYSVSERLHTSVIRLPGIAHIIATNPREPERSHRDHMNTVMLEHNLHDEKAIGHNHARVENDQWIITPLIWVRRTDTIMAETACASAVMALGIREYQKNRTSVIDVVQPSGTIFTNTITPIARGIDVIIGSSVKMIERCELKI